MTIDRNGIIISIHRQYFAQLLCQSFICDRFGERAAMYRSGSEERTQRMITIPQAVHIGGIVDAFSQCINSDAGNIVPIEVEVS